MSYIHLKHVQAAGERLLEQISILEGTLEELKQTQRRLKDMAYVEETVFLIQRSAKEIEEEIRVLRSLVRCLEDVGSIWSRTEQRIADTYNLEKLHYPRTVFHTSHITGLERYQHLIPF